MVKNLLIPNRRIFILAALATCLAMPTSAMEMEEDNNRAQIENDVNTIQVQVNNSVIRIKNADGMVMEIYSLTGQSIHTQRIESSSKSIDLSKLQRGHYIIKIGTFTRKIYIH